MISWKGKELKKTIERAVKAGIDDTMAKAVLSAKQNHPGWQNRTTTAEGSVQIQKYAHTEGSITKGVWGSKDVNYVKKLEYQHGSFLRNAADREYPKLIANIRRRIR